MEFQLIPYDRVDSTSERAFDSLARGEACHGDVHWALEQSAGRGRRGSSWHSVRGGGLYMSIVLQPAPPALHPAALTMAAGLAVLRAARAFGVDRIALKWPNDVLVEGAKLAGILVETRGQDPRRPHFVVGIGVNVRQREFPPELLRQRPVVSLTQLGCEPSIELVRDVVLRELADELERVREPARELTHDFLEATGLCNQWVEVDFHDGARNGVLESLSLERGLTLVRRDGSREHLAVEHVRQVQLVR